MPVGSEEWNAGITEAKQDTLIAEQYGDAAATAYRWLRDRPNAYTIDEIYHNAFKMGSGSVAQLVKTATETDAMAASTQPDPADASAADRNTRNETVLDTLLAARDTSRPADGDHPASDAATDALELILDQLLDDQLLDARDIHTADGVERHYRHVERDLRDILSGD